MITNFVFIYFNLFLLLNTLYADLTLDNQSKIESDFFNNSINNLSSVKSNYVAASSFLTNPLVLPITCYFCSQSIDKLHSQGLISTQSTLNSSLFDLVIDPFNYDISYPKISLNGRGIPTSIAYIYSPSDFYIHLFSGVADFIWDLQKAQKELQDKGLSF